MIGSTNALLLYTDDRIRTCVSSGYEPDAFTTWLHPFSLNIIIAQSTYNVQFTKLIGIENIIKNINNNICHDAGKNK